MPQKRVNDKDRSTLEIARAYVAAGLSLAPIKRDGSKAGALPWKPYTERLPTDAELRQWFDRAEPLGAATIGGAISGNLEIIDFDEEAATIFPAWRDLVGGECAGLFERLHITQTPRQPTGFHVRYRCADTVIPGNTHLALDPAKKGKKQVLIETRGEGGYALAPGCPAECHETGGIYRQLSGPPTPPNITAEERELLLCCARYFTRKIDPPPRQVGLDLRPRDDYDQRGPDWTEILEPHGWRCVFGSSSGERRWRRPGKEISWSATTGHCRGRDGTDLLRVFSSSAAPFDAEKAYGKFRAYALLNYGGDLSEAAEELARQGYGSRRSMSSNKPHETNGAAPHPPKRKRTVRAIAPYKPFPLEAMPPVARSLARQGAAALGCDPSFVALPLLAILASAIGNTRVIRLKRGWTEPAILWTAIIGDSGTLKSPAFSLGMQHIYHAQELLVAKHKQDCAEYLDELDRWKEAKKKHKANEGKDPGAAPEPPVLRRIVASDITIEKVAEILADNKRGTLVARDELAAWIGSFTKYKGKQGGSDVPNWLELHRAGTAIVDRKTGERRTLFIKRAAASVTGGIQPGTLARALTAELLDSGLAARLLLCWPPRQPKKWTETEIDPDTERAWGDVLDGLLALDFDCDPLGGKMPRVLRLAPEAKRLWVDFYDRWAKAQAAADGEITAAYSKLEGYAARFALLYHVVGYCAIGNDDSERIDHEAMQAGITLAHWFAGEARRVYSAISETTEERDTRRLIEFIASHGGHISVKELQRSNARRYPTADDATAALQSLADSAVGDWHDRPASSRGGRPTRIFILRIAPDETDETDETYHDEKEPSDETSDETSASI